MRVGMSQTLGRWGSVFDWPITGIHVILTPDNKILTYGTDLRGAQGGYMVYDVWDPVTNQHFTLDNTLRTDMFCSVAFVVPATDEILIAGGDARLIDPPLASAYGIHPSNWLLCCFSNLDAAG